MHERPEEYTREECYQLAAAMVAFDVAREDSGVQWRFARAAHALATQTGTPPAVQRAAIEAAVRSMQAAKRGGAATDGDLYRWAGTVLGAAGAWQSTREVIRNSFLVREDWERAVALNPTDATARHLLGRWAFEVARTPGWKRAVARTLYASPPTSTLGEALQHFLAAEAISPGYWASNQLWLGLTYEALGDGGEAARWAASALSLPVNSSEDRETRKESLALLKRVDAVQAAGVAEEGGR